MMNISLELLFCFWLWIISQKKMYNKYISNETVHFFVIAVIIELTVSYFRNGGLMKQADSKI